MRNLFKASSWNGGRWLLFLCVCQLVLVFTYIRLHKGKTGNEYIQLDKKQAEVINGILLIYTDTEPPTGILVLDTTDPVKLANYIKYKNTRLARTKAVMRFLETEYDSDLDVLEKEKIEGALNEYNSRDVGIYFSKLKIKVHSYFWFSEGKAYFETILWCLLGVFTSLIFYVGIKTTPTDPDEIFDINEISNQVAKMFYAPVTTLVLIIGYHFIRGNDDNMIDISVNKGVILFSFLAGFYSGRVMKLLDKIKDLILPLTRVDKTSVVSETKKARIWVQLSLSPSMAGTPQGADITESGFNAAVVTLTPLAGGEAITLSLPTEDQHDTFMGDQIIFGKYMLGASYAYKEVTDNSIINLAGEKEIEIKENNASFSMVLEKTNYDG